MHFNLHIHGSVSSVHPWFSQLWSDEGIGKKALQNCLVCLFFVFYIFYTLSSKTGPPK